jgi:GNAT superfamily N-acetyltransferase
MTATWTRYVSRELNGQKKGPSKRLLIRDAPSGMKFDGKSRCAPCWRKKQNTVQKMKSDKSRYPEIILIDGIEHNGKRNMSKGQILIPYTDAPNVRVGDVIVKTSGKKDEHFKVTNTSFIEDGSFGIGTDHPHLLALKVVNTSAQPQVSKTPTSTAEGRSAPGDNIPDRQRRIGIKTISMQQFMKNIAKNPGDESTATEKPIAQDKPDDSATRAEAPAVPKPDKKPGPPTGKAGATQMNMEVRLLTSEDELKAVAPVLLQLRPHFDLNGLVTHIKIQQKSGYKLAYVVSGGKVLCVAGFVTGYKLAWGKHIYIDDLVTDEEHRSTGAGKIMMEWFRSYAREYGYKEIHLDSSVLRHLAHKFYIESGFHIVSHHFALTEID